MVCVAAGWGIEGRRGKRETVIYRGLDQVKGGLQTSIIHDILVFMPLWYSLCDTVYALAPEALFFVLIFLSFLPLLSLFRVFILAAVVHICPSWSDMRLSINQALPRPWFCASPQTALILPGVALVLILSTLAPLLLFFDGT